MQCLQMREISTLGMLLFPPFRCRSGHENVRYTSNA